jgi:hypothetical protein
MQIIQHTELSSSQSSITFSSIPQTYTDLVIKLSTRSTSTGGGTVDIRININGGGSGNNITNRLLYGTGSSVASVTNSTAEAGFANNAGATANTFASNEIYFPNYTSNVAKSFSLESVQETNATGASQMILAGLWNSTSAITSITFTMLSSNFDTYTSATLYGILKGSSGGVTVS